MEWSTQVGAFLKITKKPRSRLTFDKLLDLVGEERVVDFDFETRLFGPDYQKSGAEMYLIGSDPALSSPFPWEIGMKYEETGFAPIAEADIAKCKAEFEQAFRDLIPLIEPHVKKVEIVFGAFSSWS